MGRLRTAVAPAASETERDMAPGMAGTGGTEARGFTSPVVSVSPSAATRAREAPDMRKRRPLAKARVAVPWSTWRSVPSETQSKSASGRSPERARLW